MKPTVLRRIAAVSLLFLLARAEAARRPRYGGELRVEMRETPAGPESLDPRIFSGAIFETLIRLDQHGNPQPWLAVSWTHDEARKRWIFTPRAGVTLHNGDAWSPGPIEIADDQPIDEILRDLARPRNAIVVRSADGSLSGTGPFRIAAWDPGKSATLGANDVYWGGRPFLDGIRISMARGLREQSIDLEVGGADVVESPLKPRGAAYLSKPDQLLALKFEERVPANTRQALALAIDRAAIYNVLLQKTGEISGALLPEWLTGYAFLFPAARDLARAKQLALSGALTFSYDRQDPLLRAIAERIAVNAAEAGLALRPAARGDVQLLTLPVTSLDPATCLRDLAEILQLPAAAAPPFEAERALLAGYRVVPLFHLPQVFSLSGRVRNWPRLADVWLDSKP